MPELRGERWKPERPAANSLWLLPSGPDQVGENYVRPTSGPAYGEVVMKMQGGADDEEPEGDKIELWQPITG